MICRNVIWMPCSNKVQSVLIKIFKYSIPGGTPTDTDYRVFSCSGPDVGSDGMRLPAIPGAMLLTILLNFGLEDLSNCL